LLRYGLPVLLLAAAVMTWRLLPREVLPPQKSGDILDRASTGQTLLFNEYSPDRKKLLLLSGSDIWEMPNGTSYATSSFQGWDLSSDGLKLLSNGSIYNLQTKVTTPLETPEPTALGVQDHGTIPNKFVSPIFSKSGSLIAAARVDGSLLILDASTGHVVHTLRQGIEMIPSDGEPCYIFSAAFSAQDRMLASGEMNGYVSLWNPDTGDLIATLPSPNNPPCDGSGRQLPYYLDGIHSLGFSPKGDRLASADGLGMIRVWNISTRSLLYALPVSLAGTGSTKVEFSPDGLFLVTSTATRKGGMVLVLDASNGHLLRGIAVDGTPTFDFLPNNDLVIAARSRDRVKSELWSIRSKLRIPFLDGRQTTEPAVTDSALLQEYEEAALAHLGNLQNAIGMHMGTTGHGSFPHAIQELGFDPHNAKEQFNEQGVGYLFSYSPGSSDSQSNISAYTIAARPLLFNQTGVRSFLIDQNGHVHSTTDNRAATLGDPEFRTLADAIQIASPLLAAAGMPVSTGTSPAGATSSLPGASPQPASAGEDAKLGGYITEAEAEFQQSDYNGALKSCDEALSLDPDNSKARQLKAKILQTMSILGKN
jgi:WD40 repeat protein